MSSVLEQQASECFDLNASPPEPASKRARIEVDSFNKLDLSQFTLKDNGRSKNGGINVYPLIAGDVVRFNLTPDDWLQTPFGFNLDGAYENPSFLGGKAPEKVGTPEGLSLKVNLAAPQAEFVKKLDDTARTSFAKFADAKWNPLVVENDKYSNFLCKFNVIFSGDGLTKIIIVDDRKILRGEGWEFLKEHGFTNGTNAFKRADVKLSAKIKKLWHVAGKAGLTLEATQLVLRIATKPNEEDVFGDDEKLLR